jgi:mRNA interferase RelE/StbE
LHRIELSSRAAKQLRKLARSTQLKLAAAIDALASEPRPKGYEKLKGSSILYRIRVSDYRVIYTIEDSVLLVLVVSIADRKETYRRLRDLEDLAREILARELDS